MQNKMTRFLSYFLLPQIAASLVHAETAYKPIQIHPSGFYLGLGVGESTLFASDQYKNHLTFDGFNKANIGNTIHNENTATLFEGHIGYNYNIHPKTYLGVKGSIFYTPVEILNQSTALISTPPTTLPNSPLSISLQNINQISMEPVYNINGVLTYALLERLSSFVEAGVSFSNVRNLHSQKNLIEQPATATSIEIQTPYNTNGFDTGYNVGLGANYQLSTHWLLSGQITFHDLGQYSIAKSYTSSAIQGSTASTSTRAFQMLSVFASFSYLFSEKT